MKWYLASLRTDRYRRKSGEWADHFQILMRARDVKAALSQARQLLKHAHKRGREWISREARRIYLDSIIEFADRTALPAVINFAARKVHKDDLEVCADVLEGSPAAYGWGNPEQEHEPVSPFLDFGARERPLKKGKRYKALVQEGDYGHVVVIRGRKSILGKVGYYDDDERGGAVVYFEAPLVGPYRIVPRSALRPATEEEAEAWEMEHANDLVFARARRKLMASVRRSEEDDKS